MLLDYIKILNKKVEDVDAQKETVSLSFKPTKISEKAILHIEQVLLQSESISSFYRRLFNAYARKTKNEREKIIHKEVYSILQKAIKLGVQVCAKLETGNIVNNLSVYDICSAKDELFNYVLGYSNPNNVTVRLAKIKKGRLKFRFEPSLFWQNINKKQ